MKKPGLLRFLFLLPVLFPSLLFAQAMELRELYTVEYKKDISSLLDSLKEDLYPKSSTTGSVHFYRGLSYLHQKYYREAIGDFKSARIDSTVSKMMCNFYIGLAYLELDLPDSIWDVCSNALAVPVEKLKKPDYWENSPFSKDLVFFSFLLGTNQVLHTSSDTALIDALFGFATKESKFFEAFVNYGNYCFTIGRYQKAVDLFLKARELNKTEDKLLLLGMGYFYRLSADLKQSEKAYNMLLAGNGNFAAGYNNRGCLYGFLEKYDAALRDLNRAIKLNRSFAEAYCNRGLVYLKTQKWDNSIADFSTTLQFQPDNANAFYYRGFAKKNKGDLPGSVVDFTRALELKVNYQQ
jgi:tetratricopeptide (TPR) repeat protein